MLVVTLEHPEKIVRQRAVDFIANVFYSIDATSDYNDFIHKTVSDTETTLQFPYDSIYDSFLLGIITGAFHAHPFTGLTFKFINVDDE
jgi:hypothetical protein